VNGPRAVHHFTIRTADEPREQGIVGQRIDDLPLKPEDRLPAAMCAAPRHWAVVLIAGLSDRLGRLVRHPSPPEPSMRVLFEEANLGLASIHDELDMSLRDLDAHWDEISQQLDRVNELLRNVVEDVAARQAPPREPG
jgi:hypothetical protein